MAKSIQGQSPKSQTPISTDSASGISSLESEFGPTLFDLRDFQTTENASPHPVRASRSRRRGNVKPQRIDDTFGQTAFDSSPSENLSFSLVNRFRLRTEGLGSTLFRITWKAVRTPSGRRIYAARASDRPMQETDYTSWPTPAKNEFETPNQETLNVRREKLRVEKQNGNGFGLTLGNAAQLAAWPTVQARGWKGPRGRAYKGEASDLPQVASLASWATPTKRDGKDGSSVGTAPTNALLGRQVWLAGWGTPQKHNACGTKTEDAVLKMKEAGHGVVNLNEQVRLAGWATPVATERSGQGEKNVSLMQQARSTDSGETPTGSTADLKDLEKQESIGQLNPRHSGWMMGLPPIWDVCAFRAVDAMKQAKAEAKALKSSSRSSKKAKRVPKDSTVTVTE